MPLIDAILIQRIAQDDYQEPILDLRGIRHPLEDGFYAEEEFRQLFEALQTNHHIRELYLPECVRFEGLMAQFIAANVTLQKLSFFVTSDVALSRLPENATLKELSLSGSINRRALDYIMENHNLVKLSLFQTSIGDAGAEVLSRHDTLEDLRLFSCDIHDEGAVAFGENIKLRTLDLAYNYIGCAGAKGLCRNKTLTELDLSSNALNDISIADLAKMPLLTLKVAHNQFLSKACLEELAKSNIENIDASYIQGYRALVFAYDEKLVRVFQTGPSLSELQVNIPFNLKI